MTNLIKRYCGDENGTTAIEYGLIATLICVAVIASMVNLGNGVQNTWNKIASKMT